MSVNGMIGYMMVALLLSTVGGMVMYAGNEEDNWLNRVLGFIIFVTGFVPVAVVMFGTLFGIIAYKG